VEGGYLSRESLHDEMGNSVNMTEMTEVFEAIRASFPHLNMELKCNDKQVEMRMHIPRQRRLAFDVDVNLRSDQLHLRAGPCTFQWFPCTSADVVASFREAVQGVLSGNFRIVEHCRLGRPIRAELQKPELHSWQTIGTWRRLHLPCGKKSMLVLQNADGADAV
jgi:hypothetical protein